MTRARPTRYALGGTAAAVLALVFLLPLAGTVALYCGYRVHAAGERVYGGLVAAAGSVPVLLWLGGLVPIA
ncbi:hypothetical protein RYH80_17240 [Halobaculum sp. MBLA0147]|uniref:hypothetical protein n=1 Tax=Halobaculum sp. MBLA0147 TaxID=3079934 RepID=UPI0035233A68